MKQITRRGKDYNPCSAMCNAPSHRGVVAKRWLPESNSIVIARTPVAAVSD